MSENDKTPESAEEVEVVAHLADEELEYDAASSGCVINNSNAL
jgi:hypothetical protein